MTRHSIRSRLEEALAKADAPEAEHVFILRRDAAAKLEADAADAAHRAGSQLPFLGVPITVKDNFALAGYATTAGSRLLVDAAEAPVDANVVQRLRSSGFIVLGRTNMTEFAFSGLGLNPHYGTPVNPAFADEARIPGGSSSGAAVAVALDIAPLSVGTDTGGSIRIPASLCGLTGFKPTAASIDQAGVLPLSSSLDAIGVIGRSVADCTALFEVLRSGRGTYGPVPPLSRLRLGLVENYVTNDMDVETSRALDAAVAALEQAGISIERIHLDVLDSIPEMMAEATFPAAEAYAWHQPLLGRRGEYDPRVLARIEAGGRMTAGAYINLLKRRRAMISTVADKTRGLDALLWASVPQIAPTIASLTDDDSYYAANALMLRNPSVVNLLDGCAFSIPCPVAGAPVGLSVSGLQGADDHLIRATHQIEAAFKAANLS